MTERIAKQGKKFFLFVLFFVLSAGILMPASFSGVEAKKKKKAIAPIELSGSGTTATQTFVLQRGVSILEMSHTGESDFVVEVLKSNGEFVEMPANAIGNYSGKKAIGISKRGNYLLSIEADGDWNITITQPRPSSGVKKPVTFTGVGDDVPQFLYIKKKGLVRFNMSHDGESNFIIWLMDGNGNLVDLLVNEIGSFSGSKALKIRKKGVYLLDVKADGNWSVSIN